MAKQSVISQLATASEEALAKLASSDFANNAIQGVQQVKDRVERLVKSVAELDDRLEALEQRVSALEPKQATPAKKTATDPGREEEARGRREAPFEHAQGRILLASPLACLNGWLLDRARLLEQDPSRYAVRPRGMRSCRAPPAGLFNGPRG